jgi:hypothetical protein
MEKAVQITEAGRAEVQAQEFLDLLATMFNAGLPSGPRVSVETRVHTLIAGRLCSIPNCNFHERALAAFVDEHSDEIAQVMDAARLKGRVFQSDPDEDEDVESAMQELLARRNAA